MTENVDYIWKINLIQNCCVKKWKENFSSIRKSQNHLKHLSGLFPPKSPTRTHSQLVHKQTLKHLTKQLSRVVSESVSETYLFLSESTLNAWMSRNSLLKTGDIISDFAPVLSKEFRGFTLKPVRDMIRTYSHLENWLKCMKNPWKIAKKELIAYYHEACNETWIPLQVFSKGFFQISRIPIFKNTWLALNTSGSTQVNWQGVNWPWVIIGSDFPIKCGYNSLRDWNTEWSLVCLHVKNCFPVLVYTICASSAESRFIAIIPLLNETLFWYKTTKYFLNRL